MSLHVDSRSGDFVALAEKLRLRRGPAAIDVIRIDGSATTRFLTTMVADVEQVGRNVPRIFNFKND